MASSTHALVVHRLGHSRSLTNHIVPIHRTRHPGSNTTYTAMVEVRSVHTAHMLWKRGARPRKLSNDIHPFSGPGPPRSVRFVTLNVGGPRLSRRRWGRLLQEVIANEPAIVGLQKFGFLHNHLAWTVRMAKIPPLYPTTNINPVLCSSSMRACTGMSQYSDATLVEKGRAWPSNLLCLTCPRGHHPHTRTIREGTTSRHGPMGGHL